MHTQNVFDMDLSPLLSPITGQFAAARIIKCTKEYT